MCEIEMKPSSRKWGAREVSVLDASLTFENFRFLNSKSISKSPNELQCKEIHRNFNFTALESSTNVQSFFLSKKSKNDFKCSDIESNFTSISQVQEKCLDKNLKSVNCLWQFEPTNSKSVFTNAKEAKYQSYDGNDSALSISTQEINSDESFLTMMTRTKRKFEFINPKDEFPDYSKALRLFNKNGKPLTDRMGRPLVDILGQPLVVLDNQGRIISDMRGNQVFNTLGESGIYSSTNLFLSPSEEEPGIPLLDIDKKHILFLYDNKGHPLTDCLGRPLVKASGSLMIGMDPREMINVDLYKENQLRSLYGKAPLENFVRRVQIFDSLLQPLTNEDGKVLIEAKIICNKSGMPMCDKNGRPLFFKYGARIITPQPESLDNKNKIQTKESHHKFSSQDEPQKSCELLKITTNLDTKKSLQVIGTKLHSKVVITEDEINDDNNHSQNLGFKSTLFTSNDVSTNETKSALGNLNNANTLNPTVPSKNIWSNGENPNKVLQESLNAEPNNIIIHNVTKIPSQWDQDSGIDKRKDSSEAIVIFDASKKMDKHTKSSMNTTALNNIKSRQMDHRVVKRKLNKNVYTTNFVQYFKNALNLTGSNQNSNNMSYNDYGTPMKDLYGNLLYDKFGIPLTGAQGRKLSEKARHTLRMKLRSIPVLPVNKKNVKDGKNKMQALACNESHDQFGNPYHDKYGRPVYDMHGNLIYDTFGRPLTDAYGRPLIDGIGQPLMDSQGNVLTAGINTSAKTTPTDLFGRHLYDKHGRSLFDSYGRPRFDIFTNAIYGSCGRPATDGNGNIFYDFLNKPIQPHPSKPLYKNVRTLLPNFIDQILAMPSLRRVLKYSWTSLTDAFGGPLFDDFGRPLYNKIGKPLYDKYGRLLYKKDGKPLCDCYGRPLSEEIQQSPDDQTLSVVDSLKLLKLTKESNEWMEVKRSQTQNVKPTDSGTLDKTFIMKVGQPAKKKSTQYTYALTRVTTFSCGRQALEILEAPLSPSTANEMHHLPVDSKPLIMMAQRRLKVTKKCWTTKHHH
uniref:Uncharacterized protein n=1 Tax=Graphocephala atropunctata TaxID=36148 RepID=A0A1B6LHV4_9HEMI